MRVFVTGATGFVGSAIVAELLGAGHQVLGLARSKAAARALIAAGAQVQWGELENADSLRQGAAAADGVIHTAFNHDFSNFRANAEADRNAIEALGAAVAGSERPLVVTSAIGVVAPGRLALEVDGPTARLTPRVATEEAATAVAERGGHLAVVRLPPSVHGPGDHAFVPTLINIAREKGVSAYVGDGLNRWPAVHRLDAARLFRLALEQGTAGARYHGVADEGVAFRAIAELIGERLHLPVVSQSPDEATAHFGWFAHFAALDCPASSAHTRQRLGWQPGQAGLLADLDGSNYFTA